MAVYESIRRKIATPYSEFVPDYVERDLMLSSISGELVSILLPQRVKESIA